jgi:hypothetical protein
MALVFLATTRIHSAAPSLRPWAAVSLLSSTNSVSCRDKGTLEKRAQEKREVAYESALRSYSEALRPGMTRKEVEDYLRFRLIFSMDTKEFSKGVHEQSVFSHM